MTQCEYSKCDIECPGRFCKHSHSTMHYKELRDAKRLASKIEQDAANKEAIHATDDTCQPNSTQPIDSQPVDWAHNVADEVRCRPIRTDHCGRIIE